MMSEIQRRGQQRCGCRCHWDWSWLRFGDTRISPTDVDCLFVVERKGRFLFIETKRVTEIFTEGQRILLERLSWVPGFTVFVLRGESGEPEVLTRVERGVWKPAESTSRELVQARIDVWFHRANESPSPRLNGTAAVC